MHNEKRPNIFLYLKSRCRKQGGQIKALFLNVNIDASKEIVFVNQQGISHQVWKMTVKITLVKELYYTYKNPNQLNIANNKTKQTGGLYLLYH